MCAIRMLRRSSGDFFRCVQMAQTVISAELSPTLLLLMPADSGYRQMPWMPPIILQLAPSGQPPKKQVRAQYLLPVLESWSAQFGFAAVPGGMSVGHGAESQ